MDGHFRRRQSEDQPAVSDVDVRQREHVAQERGSASAFVL
jgi:hypothetical protein